MNREKILKIAAESPDKTLSFYAKKIGVEVEVAR